MDFGLLTAANDTMERLLLLFLLFLHESRASIIPEFSNTCWDNDPLTVCPVSGAANDRYVELAMRGGLGAPEHVTPDDACVRGEVGKGLANASLCMEALKRRMVLDEEEVKSIKCSEIAFLGHTWWDGPMVRVVALFLRSFRATQHAQCAELIVWTPRLGSERSTDEARALVESVEAMGGAKITFQALDVVAMAKDTMFEDFVNRTIKPKSWETSKPGDKKEGTSHFSDFFQLFVLWRYGGIYFDADMVLLRDLYPLWGLNFEYQWSFIPEKFNNAVQGLRKGEGEKLIIHGGKLRATSCCRGWGATLWRAMVVKASNTYGLPCSAFDPFWLRMDGHHTGELQHPTLNYPPNADRHWLFTQPYQKTKDWYRGAFGIHWHGGAGGPQGGNTDVWQPTFLEGSYALYWEQDFIRRTSGSSHIINVVSSSSED